MKSENVKQIKAEDKKVFRKFVVILILSMLAGGVIGVLINLLREGAADAIANAIIGFLAVISPAANFVLTVAILIPVVLLYKKCRELYKGWDGEKEEDLNLIEVYLSYALWLSSLLISIPFFFLAAGAYTISFKEMSGIGLLSWFISFIVAEAVGSMSQQKIVNFTKEINPEKRGSVFDMKFAKKWEESCDEAEKINIYKSAYKSYRSVQMTCMVLLLVCILGDFVWHFGLMPVAMVLIIWIVQITSYSLESIGLTKGNKEIRLDKK